MAANTYTPLFQVSEEQAQALWNPPENDFSSYTLVIENPHFGIADYSESVGHNVIQFMAEGYDYHTDQPRKEKFTVGDGFVIQHNGRIIMDPNDDKRGPTGGSLYGKWIKNSAECGLMSELRKNGRHDTRDAEIWRGAIVQLKPVEYKIKGGEKRTMAAPAKFIGWIGDKSHQQQAPAQGSAQTATTTPANGSSAAPAGNGVPDDVAAEMLGLVATTSDFASWRTACLNSPSVRTNAAAIQAATKEAHYNELKASLG